MKTVTEILNAIESLSERAGVKELRLLSNEVLHLRTSLSPDDRDHAEALLLKLDRLVSDQVVVPGDAASAPRFEQVAQAA
jgi:hypothetical protein